MTAKDTYTLRYVKNEDGWGFEIESFSNRQTSYGYPTKKDAKRATPEILRAMRLNGKRVKRK